MFMIAMPSGFRLEKVGARFSEQSSVSFNENKSFASVVTTCGPLEGLFSIVTGSSAIIS